MKRETKAVTVRFGLEDYDQFQLMSKKLGVPWTDLVKVAVKLLVYLYQLILSGGKIKLVRPDGSEEVLAILELECMVPGATKAA